MACWGRGSNARSRASDQVTSVILPEHPHADDATVEGLHAATAAADVLVAVGSGTINDLCKYVSAQDGKPYVVYGTAPSMNGYVSVNAAITVGGLKKSLAAQAPLGVFLDLSILAAAPPRMIRSGLGDSLCRPTAQADWLLAHLLFDHPYRRMPFVLLEEDESALLARRRRPDERRSRRHGAAGAHAAALGLRHRHLRQQPAGEPGRASDQPLHRYAPRPRSALLLPWRADRGDDPDLRPAAGTSPGGAAAGAPRPIPTARPISSSASGLLSGPPAGGNSPRRD